MAGATRGVRGLFGDDHFGKLEKFQLDRFGDAGIEAAVARTGLSMSLTRAGTPVRDGQGDQLRLPDRSSTLALVSLGDNVLGAGEVALVSYETDVTTGGSPDGIRFVLLDSVAAGTTIYITDRGWNGTAFTNAAGEGTYTWVAGGPMAAGTVITLSHAQLATGGVNLSNAGETLYFYQGAADAPTGFLFAADIADGNSTFNGSLVNTGLANGQNAVAVAHDNANYHGAPTGIAQTQLTSISTTAHWHGTDQDDIPGTANYSEVIDTTIHSPFFGGHDMVILAGMAGGGQSDAILRIGEEDNAGVHAGFTRLFRDNPAFNHISDVAFDLDNGFYFFVDSDGNSINRIMRGNIADLVSGTSTPSFTELFATDGLNNGVGPATPGEIIQSMEVNRATNKIVWIDGDFFGNYEGGWEVRTMNYDGTANTVVAVIDTENGTGTPFGVTGISDYALHETSNVLYIVASLSGVDGLGNATVYTNHLMSVNLTTGAITTINMGAADGRTTTGGGTYQDGRLDPTEGQIIGIDVHQTTGIVYFVTQPISSTDTSGIWSWNPATDTLVELWQQPSRSTHNTLQTFPISNMIHIEVDEVSGRLFITTTSDSDTEHDGTPATNESDASIFVLAIGAAPGTAPTRFARVYEPTANGSPLGLEINYDANVAVTSLNATYTESTNLPGSPAGPVVTPYNNAAVTDPDNTQVWGATVAITAGFFPGDTLSFTNSGGITGSYNAANGVVSFTGVATLAQYQTVLNSIRFTNAGDNPTNYGNATSRTLSITVFDGLTHSDLATVSIAIVGINDAPVNVVGATAVGNEDAGIAITGMSVSDPDADPASQDIQVTLTVTNGTLSLLTNVVGGITAGDLIGNGTATVVITATQNQINATFAGAGGVTFNPTADYNGAATLTVTTNDLGLNGNDPGLTGTGTTEQDQDVKNITINAVNDAPTVLDATQAAATILEDIPSAAGETVVSLFTASFSDAADQQQTGGNPTGSVAHTLAGIAVVGGSTGASGDWEYFNGTSWVDIGPSSTGAAVLIGAGTAIRFNPALNFNGSPPDLVVHLVDSSGAAIVNGSTVNLTGATGGTTRYSAATVALAQDVTPVNDAPTTAGIAGDSVTFTEGQALAALLDAGSNATVADVDSPDFDTGTLTVAITGGLVAAEDRLVIRLTGTVSFNATNVFVNGTDIGTYAGHNSSGPLVFTFNANATPARVAELIRAVAYNNVAGDDPTDGDRTISWTLVDGDGTANTGVDTIQFTSTVDVDPVNDEPAGTDNTFTIDEDVSHIFTAGDFGFSDPIDNDAFAGVVLTTLPASGDLYLNGVAITVAGTFITAADIAAGLLTYEPDPNASGTAYATFTFQVRDDGGALDGGVDTDLSPNTITFNVTAVNDPVTTNAPASLMLNEDATNVAVTGLSISDVDAVLAPAGVYEVTLSATNGLLTLTTVTGLTFTTGDGAGNATMTFHGTLADINAALATASYTPTANYNGSATITLDATDTFGGVVATGTGPATNDSDVVNVTVTAINDTPVITVATPLAVDEQVAEAIAPAGTLADIDLDARNGGNGDYGGSVLTVSRNGGATAQDVLSIVSGAGFTVNGSNLEAGGLVFATVSGGNGTPLVITFTSSGTPATSALADAVLQAIQYVYTGDTPPASIVLDLSLNDGAPGNAGQGGGGSPTGATSMLVNITDTPENAAPTLDLDGDDSNTVGTGYTAAFTEGGAAVLITDVDVAIADANAGDMIEGATIAINGPVAGDQLVLGPQGGFVVTGSGTGTIMITGTGTAAQYEAMLELITFTNGTDDPGASRTINITVTDGTDTSNVAVATINITEINDEPTLTATGGTPVFTEGDAQVDLFSAVTASTIEAGQTFSSLTLTVSNVTDGASELLRIDGSDVALTNGNVVATALNALFVSVTVTGSLATVTFSGAALSAAALQILVDGLAYRNSSENPTDANRVVTITQVVDSGSNVSPNDNTTTLNIAATVNVNPVNDPPVNSVPGTQTINEDGSVTFSTGNGNALSVSDADATTLTVTLTVQHGTLTLASSAGLSFGAGDGTNDLTMTFTGTAAAINAALGSGLTYSPEANFNGSDTIAMQTTDNGQSGGPTQTDNDSVTVNITAINDAPVVIGDGTEQAADISEDSPGAGQTIQALFAGQYSDAADNQIPNGGASSPGQFSGIAVTANGSSPATGQWQYFSGGVWTDIGAASDSAAVLLGDPFGTLIRFNPAANFNGPAPTLTVHLIDNSLPFGIVNGMVVDISGPGATGGTTPYSTGTVALSQNVTAVNDAPVNTVPGSQTINEDGSFTLSTGNGNAISVADVDAATLTVTLTVANGTLTLASTAGLSFGAGDGTGDATMTFSGTAAAINAALGSGLTYNPTANYNGPDSITVLTTDNGQTGTGGTLQDNDIVNITINSVNDAPQGTDNTVTGSEDDPYVFTLADFGYSDPVEGNAFLAVIIDSFPANGTLFLDPDGPGGAAPVDLSTVGPGVFVSASDIALGRLYFQPDTDEFGDAYATFTFRVQDDGGMANGGVDRDPVANTMTIDIEPDNLPPVVDLDGGTGGVDYATTFVEDGAAVAIGSGVSVSDPDSVTLGDMIESATITLTDRVAGDSLTLTGTPPVGFVAVTTEAAGTITIQITGTGTGAQYQALIESIVYSTTNQDPTVGGTDPTRTITVTVNDGDIDSAVATTTVNITPIDDLPVAQPDAFTTTESGPIVAGNLFANNGSGPDSDPDGPPLSISAVNGSALGVGMQITLASGALLTVNANGTFDYDPNGAFLSTPVAGSGAANTPASDSFTYTLTNGNTVTVSITLTGLDTDDVMIGTAGGDTLISDGGQDDLYGLGGNDVYHIADASDVVLEAVGEGNDVVYVGVSYELAAGQEVEVLSTSSNAATTAINLTGNEFANILYGNAGANMLAGGGGADVLIGYGDDDVYLVDMAGDQVFETVGGGNDVVYTNVSYALAAGQEVEILSVSDLGATAAIDLTGNAFNNILYGNAGINVLFGGGGTDVMLGYGGNDVFHVDSADDQVVEGVGGGTDIVYSSVSYTLAAGQEVEILSVNDHSATTAINLTGNEFVNTLYGNAGSNVLDGGAGADVMVGFGGNDIFHVETAADYVGENVGGGTDVVYTSVSYALAAGQEVEVLSVDDHSATTAIDLTGNEFANQLYGNAGANVLDGGAGADVMLGFGGNDIFYVDNAGDLVGENTGGGDDMVFASVSYALATGSEVELLLAATGTAAIDLTGNELDNTIYGNDGANVLDGKGGEDLLVGLAGADIFAFTTALGAGNVDVVFGFDSGIDRIALDDAIFAAIGPLGALNANAFVTGNAATDANDRIIYNNLTGQLYYDADGSGAGAQVQFALLSPGLTLTASDFQVI